MIKVKEAAVLIGGTEQFVRIMVQRGELGVTYGTGKQRSAYAISPASIARWNGWTVDRVEEELSMLRKGRAI